MANIGQHFALIFIDIPGLSVESCNDFLPGQDAEFSTAKIDLGCVSGFCSFPSEAGELTPQRCQTHGVSGSLGFCFYR